MNKGKKWELLEFRSLGEEREGKWDSDLRGRIGATCLRHTRTAGSEKGKS